MYPVSSTFLSEIRSGSITVVAYADMYLRGILNVANVPIIGGDITDDATAAFRRSAKLSFSPESAEVVLPGVTDWTTSPFWPIGNELLVRAGLKFRDGTEELVPQGVFRISKPVITHAEGNLAFVVDAIDRARTISRNRFTDAYTIAVGTDYANAIKTLLQNRLPLLQDADFDFMKTDGSDGGPIYKTPLIVFLPQDDPWEGATKMAASFGAELYFNGSGKPVLRTVPDPLYTPSQFDMVSGEDSIMTQIVRTLDDEQAYNGVQASGISNDPAIQPPYATVWDTNPDSPTYYDPAFPNASTYGPVPKFYASEFITTTAQATSAAISLLIARLGILESISLDAVPNYALESHDVSLITDVDSGVNNVYIYDSLRKGLGHTAKLSGTTRRRRAA